MPHRRRYRKRKGHNSMAYKALKLARSIKSGQERKFFDTTVSLNTNFTGSSAIILNEMAQGITDETRIGDSVKCLSFRFRYACHNNGSTATAIRSIFIWDKRNTITGLSDVLQLLGAENALLSDYVHDKRSDYIVLYDKMIRCDGQYISKNVGMVHKKLNKKTQFNGGSTIIEKGALKLFLLSDVSTVQPSQPDYRAYIRVFYSDG